MLFIADVHLGKLARMLRMLGFDVLYSNEATPAQLIAFAAEQNRVLLSRYAPFAKATVSTLIINSSVPYEQLQQIITHFHLADQIQPFTRCLVCNGHLKIVAKEIILEQLEPNTRQAFNDFWQCVSCERIYWKGSHYERMMKLVAQFTTEKQ